MDDCLFCQLSEGKIPAKVVHQDPHTIAFLDIAPRSPGHTMVIPRVHAAVLSELPPEEVEPLFRSVQKVSQILKRSLSPDGLTIGINEGTVSGQAVPHLHVHIMTRFQNDRGGSIHSAVNNPPKETLDEILQRITKGSAQPNT